MISKVLLKFLPRFPHLTGLVRRCSYFQSRWYVSEAARLLEWHESDGTGPPPPMFKANLIRSHAIRYDIPCFVETGTYLGDTIRLVSHLFDLAYSIELDPALHRHVSTVLCDRDGVVLLEGDSRTCLPVVMDHLPARALFWLDAHCSQGITAGSAEGPPVLHELSTVGERAEAGSVVLVDDARLFGSRSGYPSIDRVRRTVDDLWGDEVDFAVEDDIIRITPSGP